MLPVERKALVVLGMHRSGTSAMSGALHLSGIDLGPGLMPPAADNPKGFFENKFITDCNDEILRLIGSSWDDPFPLPEGWHQNAALAPLRDRLTEYIRGNFPADQVIGFKDPRLCVLMPLWKEIFSGLGIRPCFIIMLRNPAEIALSLGKRNGTSREKALVLSMKHLLEAERETRGCQRCFVRFEDLLAAPERVLAGFARDFGIRLEHSTTPSSEKCASFLDPSLRHHVLGANCAPYAIADECFDAITQVAVDDSAGARARLDSLRDGFGILSRLFCHHELLGSVRALPGISGELAATRARAEEYERLAKELREQIGKLHCLLEERERLLEEGRRLLEERQCRIEEQFREIRGLEQELGEAHGQLEAIRSSRGWKMLARYYRVRDWLRSAGRHTGG